MFILITISNEHCVNNEKLHAACLFISVVGDFCMSLGASITGSLFMTCIYFLKERICVRVSSK